LNGWVNLAKHQRILNDEGLVVTSYFTDKVRVVEEVWGEINFFFDEESDVLDLSR